MKKTFFLLLWVALIFNSCSKDSTDAEPVEDVVKIEVLVRENGSPTENIFVIIDATVTDPVRVRSVGVVDYETTQTDQLTTNVYGKVTFSYRDKSIPDRNGIIVLKVTIKKLSSVMLEDTEEKFVEKGKTLKLEYDI